MKTTRSTVTRAEIPEGELAQVIADYMGADRMRLAVQGFTHPKQGEGRSLVVTVTEPMPVK